jgi:LAO/AO transport system kinase
MAKASETPARLDLDGYVEGIRKGDRGVLGRAITLAESRLPEDRGLAKELIAALAQHAGAAHRVGITGVPGAGKSTFIEAFGKHLTGLGRRVAVLAVDPSSIVSGGSILGDKTRMQELSRDPNAFVRPSPSAGALGGVARNTREAVLLCEAAGYDVVLVETVGVGQSELTAAQMVDTFLVLVLARGGDELQGIKRGLLELADLLAVTKADGDNVAAAELARQEYAGALRLMEPRSRAWTPRVSVCSALTGDGIAVIWDHVAEHRRALEAADEWNERRRRQRIQWMWRAIDDALINALRHDDTVRAKLLEIEEAVLEGTMAPEDAATMLVAAFRESPSDAS